MLEDKMHKRFAPKSSRCSFGGGIFALLRPEGDLNGE